MIRALTTAILLFFLTPGQINAWWPFAPTNSDDCILKYQKEAKCKQASILINVSCKCKFSPLDFEDPLGLLPSNYCQYNSAVYDCILDNIGNAQNDQAASAISRSCISKYNK